MKALDLFFAARPLLHLPLWSVYLVTLHYHDRAGGNDFALADLAMMFCLSLMAAGTYYLNQIYDVETDRMNAKLGFLERRFLSGRDLMIGFVVLSIISLIAVFFFSAFMSFIFAQSLFLGILYSGPLFRLKDRPVAGLIANAYAFGLLVPLTVMPEISMHNAGRFDWYLPVYFFLAVGAVHCLTTVPDRSGDERAGKRTVTVWLGSSSAKILALLLLIGSALAGKHCGSAELMLISGLSFTLVAVSLGVKSDPIARAAAKLPILLLTLLAAYFYPGYLGFVVALVISCRIYYARRFGMTYPEIN